MFGATIKALNWRTVALALEFCDILALEVCGLGFFGILEARALP